MSALLNLIIVAKLRKIFRTKIIKFEISKKNLKTEINNLKLQLWKLIL